VCFLAFALVITPGTFNAEERTTSSFPPDIHAFQPGETLTYDVSWSNIVKAGTAVMEVKQETTPDDHRDLFRFIVTSHTTGMVGKLYPLGDTIQSVFDPQIMQSLSYSLKAIHGEKIRRRELVFDHVQRTVVSKVNDDPPETMTIPDEVQDSLSALYYLRTREDLAGGKVITFDVCDRGESWPVEVQALGREKVKTRIGEFNTIKVKAQRGIFMSDGEIFIWFTDDSRKVPVLIKSTVSIGSLEFILTDMKPGANAK
jgi:hypothetical protein